MGRAIEMRNVSVIRDGTTILDSIDLVINEDENVAVIGPNGSGKTTLISLLRGEIHPYYDESSPAVFRLFGMERWNLFELRSRLGVVSMDLQSAFNRDTEIRDVILSGFFSSMDVYRNHTVTQSMRDAADAVGDIMGLTDKMSRGIGKISLGEMRRTLISRALVPGPEMLVLDEPMTGLDIVMKIKFREMFDTLIANGVRMVMITHELEDIPSGVSRVVMIKDGMIFADGPKDSVLTSDVVSDLYDMRIHVECRNGSYHMYGDSP